MRCITAVLLGSLALFSGTAIAATTTPVDARFATTASASNTFEIRSSRLALRRSANPAIRAFAHQMIADHDRAQYELEQLSAISGNEAEPTLYPEQEAMLAKLDGLEGDEFDKAYVDDQVAAHRATVTALTDFGVMGYDPHLRAWAADTLPVVRGHLGHIEAISAGY